MQGTDESNKLKMFHFKITEDTQGYSDLTTMHSLQIPVPVLVSGIWPRGKLSY